MIIGVLQFELVIPHSESLKDKRRVVKSLKDRLHREHMVSVAEVDALDDTRRAMLGLAVVANEVPYVQSVLDRVLDKVRDSSEGRLGSVLRDIVNARALTWSDPQDADPAWEQEKDRMIAEAEKMLEEHP